MIYCEYGGSWQSADEVAAKLFANIMPLCCCCLVFVGVTSYQLAGPVETSLASCPQRSSCHFEVAMSDMTSPPSSDKKIVEDRMP